MPRPAKMAAPVEEETEYEKTRKQNMEANQALLIDILKNGDMVIPPGVAVSIGILGIEPPQAPKPKPKPKKKVKEVVQEDKGEDENVAPTREGMGTRRSARHANKPAVSYAGDGEHIVDRSKMPRMISRPNKRWDEDASDEEDEEGNQRGETARVNRLVGRKHDPKQFGSIPGVPIGSWWETRAECSGAAIHAPFVAGISGGPEGAYSVALSGGYDDDVDLGEAFTYTGSGGRDLKGTKDKPKNLRTAPQSSDQTFDNAFNKALKVSSETRKPIRVIRGFKLPSKYAPKSGYRYDGLYIVEKAWIEPGNNPRRFKVCKFAFRRVPGQPPIPERSAESDEEEEVDEIEDDGEGSEKDADVKSDVEMEEPEEEPEEPKAPRGRRTKAQPEPESEDEDEEREEVAPAPAKRGRGRPPKK